MGVRWYVAYPLSTRHVENSWRNGGWRWITPRSTGGSSSTARSWRRYSTGASAVWVSWRMDETYIKVKGQWRYLYRAVDKHGQTIDFLLTEHRDTEAALRF